MHSTSYNFWKKFFILLALAGCKGRKTSQDEIPEAVRNMVKAKDIAIIAHRGYPKVAPENTIPSFKAAIDAGAELVELDYRLTKDKVMVVLHDNTLDRTTNAESLWKTKNNKLNEHTFDEIRVLDAGAFGKEEFRGTKLPTLEEAIVAIVGMKKTPLIHHKAGDAESFFSLLQKLDAVDKIVVQSDNEDYLKSLRQKSSKIKTALIGEGAIHANTLEAAKRANVNIMSWKGDKLTSKQIAQTQADKFSIYVWTIDDLTQEEDYIVDGIDGIITDEPERLKTLIDEAKK